MHVFVVRMESYGKPILGITTSHFAAKEIIKNTLKSNSRAWKITFSIDEWEVNKDYICSWSYNPEHNKELAREEGIEIEVRWGE